PILRFFVKGSKPTSLDNLCDGSQTRRRRTRKIRSRTDCATKNSGFALPVAKNAARVGQPFTCEPRLNNAGRSARATRACRTGMSDPHGRESLPSVAKNATRVGQPLL